MKDNFLLSDLKIEKKGDKLVLRGCAAVANKVHTHAFAEDGSKSYQSYFTDKAVRKMSEDMKYRPIFVDFLHSISTKINNDYIMEGILEKYPELKQELANIKSNLQASDIPMFLFSNYELNNDKLEIEVESNPLYKDVDDDHSRVYNIITGSIQNGAINGFSVDFITKEVLNENGVDKIDDLDLLGISLVNSPAMGASTSIAEVATRNIKRIVEIRTGEQKMTENGENKPQVNVEELVNKKVEEALKQREIEAQKSRQESENLKLKEEVEQLKKERETSTSLGSKGTPKQESKMSFDDFKARVDNLSESDQIRLYAEFVTNDSTHNPLPLMKKASHQGKANDPRVTWGYESPSGSMAETYRNLMRSRQKEDMRF